jgi:dTDP-4-amino-4,6-dideoxygalactose transaminase
VTHNLDAQQVERAITERTSGILGVHAWGQGCAVEALERLAERYQLALFFDAAHALSCTDQGRLLGNRGRLEVFSFHATKFFNTFEGGAITTDDAALADELRGMRNFGFTGLDRVDRLGINAKMSEASAAMGLTSFESLEAFIAANRANYLVYQEQLAGLPGVKMLHYNPAERNNYQYIVVEIDQEQAGLSRDMLVNILQAENVLARRYFYPGVHCMAPYRELYPDAGTRLPQTEQLVRRVCVLPNGVSLSREAVERVCNLIRFTIENAEKLTVLG